MRTVKLSILMPVYNEHATLASAVKEVLNVGFPCETELVVVDDGSTDGTRDLYPALAGDPAFMLLDEPFAGVDPIAVGELQKLIASLRERGLGILITDHAVRETLGTCDRAVLLFEGKLLEAGTPAQIASSERARALYLGERFKLE